LEELNDIGSVLLILFERFQAPLEAVERDLYLSLVLILTYYCGVLEFAQLIYFESIHYFQILVDLLFEFLILNCKISNLVVDQMIFLVAEIDLTVFQHFLFAFKHVSNPLPTFG
jgi:hypothetical protein